MTVHLLFNMLSSVLCITASARLLGSWGLLGVGLGKDELVMLFLGAVADSALHIVVVNVTKQ